MNSEVNTGFSFGEFELDADRRLLLNRGETVNLHSKAFDLLLTLVENRGQVLSKNDLLDKVWENQFVEENNLTVHVAALRRALGETKNDHRYIVTVPGKGYRFVAELNEPTNGEVVVESHRFERITFEEEIEQETSVNGFQSKVALNETALTTSRDVGNKTISFNRKYAIIAAFCVVAVGGAGFWLYQRRDQNKSQNAESPISSKEVTQRTFTTAGGVPHRVAIAPDGKSLAYIQRFKGEDSIWLGDSETSNSIQIAPASDRLHEYLTFGHDGKNLYFSARDDNHLIWTLMRVSIYGGPPQDLIAGVHGQVSFSPDGKLIAFLRRDVQTERTSLILADSETGKNEQVFLQPEKPQKIVSNGVSWSPDGGLIAVGVSDEQGKNCEIAAVNIADGSIGKIGDKACSRNSNLVWLRDGSGIVLTASGGDEGSNTQIWMVSYPSGETRKITNDTLNYSNYSLSVSTDNQIAALQARSDPKIWLKENDHSSNATQILEGLRARSEGMDGLDIAPDGKILYTVRTGKSRAVWEMNADGTNQRQLTASQKASGDVQINVTADNRYIVFESHRSQNSEIWRSNRDGSNLTQLTKGGGNSEPTLSPDGLWVIYTSTQDGKSTLWRVSVDGGEPSQITKELTSWADVSPDGKYIACAFGKAVEAADKRIAVLPIDGGSPVKSFKIAKHGIVFNRLRWSPDGKSIIYKDFVQGLWRQDLDKEKPEAIKGFDDLRVFHFAYSADGKLVYSGGIPMREIVILSNFR